MWCTPPVGEGHMVGHCLPSASDEPCGQVGVGTGGGGGREGKEKIKWELKRKRGWSLTDKHTDSCGTASNTDFGKNWTVLHSGKPRQLSMYLYTQRVSITTACDQHATSPSITLLLDDEVTLFAMWALP